MHKTEDHFENLRRSKSYIADSYFPPVELKNGNLIEMFITNSAHRQAPSSPEFTQWKEALIEMIPKLSIETNLELAMYLAFEATHLNDAEIWRAVEQAALTHLHLYDLKASCQMLWACTQQKPKRTSGRFDNLLFNIALQKVDSGQVTCEDIHHIMQGHRNKKSKDIYLKLKKIMITQKDSLNPPPVPGQEQKWAEQLVNLFYSFVSNKPR